MRASPAGRVAAIGSAAEVAGFALAGAVVHRADSPDEAVTAWRSLDTDTAVVILGERAAAALQAEISDERGPLTVVLSR